MYELVNVKEICQKLTTQEGILKAVMDRLNLTLDMNQYVLSGSVKRCYIHI